MKPAYPLRRTCKEVSALLIAREDRALPLVERQLLTMRNAMGQWRNYSDNES